MTPEQALDERVELSQEMGLYDHISTIQRLKKAQDQHGGSAPLTMDQLERMGFFEENK